MVFAALVVKWSMKTVHCRRGRIVWIPLLVLYLAFFISDIDGHVFSSSDPDGGGPLRDEESNADHHEERTVFYRTRKILGLSSRVLKHTKVSLESINGKKKSSNQAPSPSSNLSSSLPLKSSTQGNVKKEHGKNTEQEMPMEQNSQFQIKLDSGKISPEVKNTGSGKELQTNIEKKLKREISQNKTMNLNEESSESKSTYSSHASLNKNGSKDIPVVNTSVFKKTVEDESILHEKAGNFSHTANDVSETQKPENTVPIKNHVTKKGSDFKADDKNSTSDENRVLDIQGEQELILPLKAEKYKISDNAPSKNSNRASGVDSVLFHTPSEKSGIDPSDFPVDFLKETNTRFSDKKSSDNSDLSNKSNAELSVIVNQTASTTLSNSEGNKPTNGSISNSIVEKSQNSEFHDPKLSNTENKNVYTSFPPRKNETSKANRSQSAGTELDDFEKDGTEKQKVKGMAKTEEKDKGKAEQGNGDNILDEELGKGNEKDEREKQDGERGEHSISSNGINLQSQNQGEENQDDGEGEGYGANFESGNPNVRVYGENEYQDRGKNNSSLKEATLTSIQSTNTAAGNDGEGAGEGRKSGEQLNEIESEIVEKSKELNDEETLTASEKYADSGKYGRKGTSEGQMERTQLENGIIPQSEESNSMEDARKSIVTDFESDSENQPELMNSLNISRQTNPSQENALSRDEMDKNDNSTTKSTLDQTPKLSYQFVGIDSSGVPSLPLFILLLKNKGDEFIDVDIKHFSSEIKSLNSSSLHIPPQGQGAVIVRMYPNLETTHGSLYLEYNGGNQTIEITPKALGLQSGHTDEVTMSRSSKSSIFTLLDPLILPISYLLSPWFTEEQSKLIILLSSFILFLLIVSCFSFNSFFSLGVHPKSKYQAAERFDEPSSGVGFGEDQKFDSWDNSWKEEDWELERNSPTENVSHSPNVKHRLGVVRKASSPRKIASSPRKIASSPRNIASSPRKVASSSRNSDDFFEEFSSDNSSVSHTAPRDSHVAKPQFGSGFPVSNISNEAFQSTTSKPTKTTHSKKKPGGKLVVSKVTKPLGDSFWDDGWK